MTIRAFLLRLLAPVRRPEPKLPPAPVAERGRDFRGLANHAMHNVGAGVLSGVMPAWSDAEQLKLPEPVKVASIMFWSLLWLYSETDMTRDELDAVLLEMMDRFE